jgi:hypothetical protein
MKVLMIDINDFQPNMGESVLIVTHCNINNIQTATYHKIEITSLGTEYLFYDGISSSITPTHWIPKSRIEIPKKLKKN